MKGGRQQLRRTLGSIIALGPLVAACSGPYTAIAPRVPDSAELGPRTSGSACGLVLLNVIPIGVNDRAERAYRRALEPTKANALADVSVVDSWYYILIGEVLCAEVSGAVVVPRNTVTQVPSAIPPAPAVVATPPVPRSTPAATAPPVVPPPHAAATPEVHAAPVIPPEVAAKTTLLEKLRELKRLHDSGALNDADWEVVRKNVIREVMGPDAADQ